ncbi:MAG: S-layer homology domain-containing protein [Chroococcidiopsidaceae cyanobacterium CP_BM_RX_35]|nr:S-layer homology domain-containing protein [Chroococcidiopsidaceae cyanobacterium CP_BM_RX_35]
MSNFSNLLSRRAVLIALTMTASMLLPLSISTLASAQGFAGGGSGTADKGVDRIDPNRLNSRAQAQTNAPAESENSTQPTFFDISSNWASPFIQALAARNIISGYPDGSFRPARVVNRADFAAMLQKAFPGQRQVQSSTGSFVDVPANYWAGSAIRNAYTAGFMTGYPGGSFHPTKYITKAQAIVALAKGLGLSFAGSPTTVLSKSYKDAKAIPRYAASGIAAATQAHIVVNYPNVRVLAPNQVISRGEAAALIYQALVTQGVLPPLAANTADANYIVGGTMERSGE